MYQEGGDIGASADCDTADGSAVGAVAIFLKLTKFTWENRPCFEGVLVYPTPNIQTQSIIIIVPQTESTDTPAQRRFTFSLFVTRSRVCRKLEGANPLFG